MKMFFISLLIIHTTIKLNTLWNQSEMCKMKHTYIRTSCTQLYFWDQIQTCYIWLIMYYLQMNKKSTARNVWPVSCCWEQKHRMKFCTLYSEWKTIMQENISDELILNIHFIRVFKLRNSNANSFAMNRF